MTNLTEVNQEYNRNIKVDILKSIGLFCIILSHVNPPIWIHQLRNFDVPLMVLVSGLLFEKKSRKSYSYWSYIQKRIPRIIFPVWFFLLFYFSFFNLFFWIKGDNNFFDLETILSSFFLLQSGGIGFVWIFRVFILISITSPIIILLNRNLNNNKKFAIAIFFIYIFCEITFKLVSGLAPLTESKAALIIYRNVFRDTIFFTAFYSCVFSLGMILRELSKKTILYLTLSFFLIFLILSSILYSISGEFIFTQDYKYPPRSYYLSYALFSSMFLYYWINIFCKKYYANKKSKLKKLVVDISIFISSSSMWIYLWHIFFLGFFLQLISSRFIYNFSIIVILSITFTYLQKKIISKVIAKTRIGQNHSRMLTMLFLK